MTIDRSGIFLRQGTASQGLTASPISFCSTPYQPTDTMLHDLKILSRRIQARPRALPFLNQTGSFDSTTLKYSEEFILFTFPGKESLKKKSTGVCRIHLSCCHIVCGQNRTGIEVFLATRQEINR